MINVLKINCGLLPIQIDPECYEWGLSARSVDMMKSIVGNDKQTMLYFKCVAISRNKLYPNRSIRNAVGICCFDIIIY